MKPKCFLAIPTASDIHAETAATVNRLSLQGDADFAPFIARPVDYARNMAINFWREHRQPCTHILFLDSDVVPPLNVVERMMAHDLPVVTGCYPIMSRFGPRWAVSHGQNPDDPQKQTMLAELPADGKPFKVDACGGGCLMIRRDVIDKVKFPWFLWGHDEDCTQHGEDFFFCYKLAQAGIDIYCDPTIICKHHKTSNLTSLFQVSFED